MHMELLCRRRWRFVSVQLSNKFGYCPSWNFSRYCFDISQMYSSFFLSFFLSYCKNSRYLDHYSVVCTFVLMSVHTYYLCVILFHLFLSHPHIPASFCLLACFLISFDLDSKTGLRSPSELFKTKSLKIPERELWQKWQNFASSSEMHPASQPSSLSCEGGATFE